MDDNRSTMKFRGMVLDGERAGEWHTSALPHLQLPSKERHLPAAVPPDGAALIAYVRVRIDLPDGSGGGDEFGFWITEEESVLDRRGTHDRRWAMQKLIEGFRPRSEDPQQRIRDAERELDAALQAAYEKRSA